MGNFKALDNVQHFLWRNVFILLLLFFLLIPLSAQSESKFRVLLVNSYHTGYDWSDQIIAGIQNIYSTHPEIELQIEHLDGKRYNTADYLDLMESVIKLKYTNRNIDLIMANDDHAFDFVKKLRNRYHKRRVPFIFGGLNNFSLESIQGLNNTYGIAGRDASRGVFNLISHLHPDTKKVLVVVDQTKTGRKILEQIKLYMSDAQLDFEIVFLTNISIGELENKIQEFPAGTPVYWAAFAKDNQGTLIPVQKSVEIASGQNKYPVYVHWVCSGCQDYVGGYIQKGYELGQQMAETSLQILDEKLRPTVPIIQNEPRVNLINYKMLRHFSLSTHNLPRDTVIINRPNSIYEQYKYRIWSLAIIFIALLILLLMLMKNIARRKKAEHKLIQHLDQLEGIIKERTIELESANLTKDRFIRILAHDLKAPFNSILGFADILIHDYQDFTDSEIFSFIEKIRKASHGTLQLLDNLLIWSKTQDQALKINREEFDLKHFLTHALDPYQENATKKHITVQLDIAKNQVVKLDEFTISTVIRNLFSNAIKYTPPHGEIKISAFIKKEALVIQFKDNGQGMDHSTLEKVFKIDEAYSTPGTENEKGTGLGLILCKELTEQHGGQIIVESELGKGTLFTISIPQDELSSNLSPNK